MHFAVRFKSILLVLALISIIFSPHPVRGEETIKLDTHNGTTVSISNESYKKLIDGRLSNLKILGYQLRRRVVKAHRGSHQSTSTSNLVCIDIFDISSGKLLGVYLNLTMR